MRTRQAIYLGGIALHDVDSSIVIQSVTESAASLSPKSVALGSQIGQRLTNMQRSNVDVNVRFCVMGARDMVHRAEVLERVCAWAAGSELTVNYRPNRRLLVTCTEYPAVGNARAWTDEYSLSFRAFEQPYWEATEETTGQADGASAKIDLNMNSPMPTVLDAEITNTGNATVNAISLSANGTTISFSSLALASGETLAITHDVMQSIMIGERSAMSKRTAASHDEVIIKDGLNEVTCTASSEVRFVLKARGRFL